LDTPSQAKINTTEDVSHGHTLYTTFVAKHNDSAYRFNMKATGKEIKRVN